MSANLTVIDCIQKYATVSQKRPLLKSISSYPYPGADGSELNKSLKNASLACDEAALEVLLDQFVNGSWGHASGFQGWRIHCLQKIEREVKKQDKLGHRFDSILQSLKNARRELSDQPLVKKSFFYPVVHNLQT